MKPEIRNLNNFRVYRTSNFGVLKFAKFLDSNGIWKPIETSDNNLFCGNTGHGNLELNTNDAIEIYVKKYCGQFDTKMRMKLLTKNKILVSDIYNGSINYGQLNIETIDFPEIKYFINKSVEDERNRVRNLTH